MKSLVKWFVLPAVIVSGSMFLAPEKADAHGGFSISLGGYGPSCGSSYYAPSWYGSPYGGYGGYGYGGGPSVGFGYYGGGWGGHHHHHHHHHGCW